MLYLELLGSLSLRSDSGQVPLAAQNKRPMSLLAILALGRQGISRHRIEAYLWPESPGGKARHALDQAIYAIRQALGSEVIQSTGQELKLNPELVSVDVWDFEEAIRAREWDRAATIYRGPLGEGFNFGESQALESWIDDERGRYLRQYQTAVESLAGRAAAAGDHGEQITWRRRLVSSDPLLAGPTKKLILAFAAAGDRAGAVKHAREYQARVRQELEIEPDSEIEGLAVALSRPSASENAGTGSLPKSPSVPAPVSSVTTYAARETDSVEKAPVEPSLRPARRVERSPRTAFAFASVVIVLVIGALMVTSAQGRDTRAGIARNAAGGSRIPLPAARQEYLGGLNAWDDRSKEGNDRAVAHFRRATELDPEYAEAWAQLAEAYVRIGYFGYRPAAAMFPKAKAAALRSLSLDSTLAFARTALASELMWEHDFAGAEAEYRKAIAFEGTNATAHQWYGVLLMILRQIPEAVAQEKIASDLEPLSLQIQNNYATFVNVSGDHAGALRQFQKTIGEEPDSAWVRRNPWVLANMSRAYADNGRYAEALQMIKRAVEIVPGSPRALHSMAVIYNGMGRRGLAREAFARADTSNDQYAAYRGMVYADEGNADSAFIWFNRQETWGIQPMLTLQADRHVDPIRSDPRFRALLARLGIPAGR